MALGGQRFVVPAEHACAFEVHAGQYLKIADIEGPQIGDLVAFNLGNTKEYLHTAFSRVGWGRIYPRVGDVFVSNLHNPMVEIVRDDVGHHDVVKAMCNPARFLQLFGVSGRRNCLDNLTEVLGPYGVDRWWLPMPLNLFQYTVVAADGCFEDRPSLSRRGDSIVFRTHMNIVCGLSACPMNQMLAGDKSEAYPLEVIVSDLAFDD